VHKKPYIIVKRNSGSIPQFNIRLNKILKREYGLNLLDENCEIV